LACDFGGLVGLIRDLHLHAFLSDAQLCFFVHTSFIFRMPMLTV